MWRLVIALPVALFAIFGAGLHPADAQGRIVARHGDWQIRCEKPVGSPAEQCALVQNVEAQDRANVGLTVIFLRTADRQARILRVLAPLGVLLPSGLGLSIDDTEVGLAGFVRCLPEGCIAEVELDDGLQERFGAGETATFVIFQTPEEGIGIPISLNGFSDGFAALDNPPPPPDVGEEVDPTVPAEAVPTTLATASDRFAAAEQSLRITDDRTEIDRLLEDPLFPYVVASAVLLLAIVLMIIMVARSRGRRRRLAREEGWRQDEWETDEEGEPAASPDDLAALDKAPRGSGPGGGRRLATGQRPRQLPKMGDGGPARSR